MASLTPLITKVLAVAVAFSSVFGLTEEFAELFPLATTEEPSETLLFDPSVALAKALSMEEFELFSPVVFRRLLPIEPSVAISVGLLGPLISEPFPGGVSAAPRT